MQYCFLKMLSKVIKSFKFLIKIGFLMTFHPWSIIQLNHSKPLLTWELYLSLPKGALPLKHVNWLQKINTRWDIFLRKYFFSIKDLTAEFDLIVRYLIVLGTVVLKRWLSSVAMTGIWQALQRSFPYSNKNFSVCKVSLRITISLRNSVIRITSLTRTQRMLGTEIPNNQFYTTKWKPKISADTQRKNWFC